MEVIKKIGSGKHNWNTFEVGVKQGKIFIRDDAGYVDFSDKEVDKLIDGIDQARRRIREIKRMPTKGNK